MNFPISREGFGIIIVLLVFVVLFGYLGFVGQNILMKVFSVITFLLLAFTIFFFRDPKRTPPREENVIVSPADGTVIEIKEVEEPDFIQGPAQRISIFLSLFNVHINYIPISGTVEFLQYKRGSYLRANLPEASEKNVHTKIGLETAFGKILFKQSVGMIARRIVCHLRYGNRVTTGQKFGIMKFGSRMEVYIPSWAKVTIHPGDKVTGAETIIGVVSEK